MPRVVGVESDRSEDRICPGVSDGQRDARTLGEPTPCLVDECFGVFAKARVGHGDEAADLGILARLKDLIGIVFEPGPENEVQITDRRPGDAKVQFHRLRQYPLRFRPKPRAYSHEPRTP